MGYRFTLGAGQYIDWGNHVLLYQSQDLSIGMWVKFVTGITNDQNMGGQADAFPIIFLKSITAGAAGQGVQAQHVKGGGSSFGVSCIPGLINPAYTLGLDQWMYFGFSRIFAESKYVSYFGTRNALADGQTFTWVPGQEPFPITQPGQVLGPWLIGQTNGVVIGPASYWDTPLTRQQHLSMARCTLPSGVDPIHLLWWTKMFEGAADVGPNMYPNTFVGNPIYEPDQGCASFGTGQDYRLYNT